MCQYVLLVALLASTTIPVAALTFCFVELASFMSGDPASRITVVPMPGANDGALSEVVFSHMSPPAWALGSPGWGSAAGPPSC